MLMFSSQDLGIRLKEVSPDLPFTLPSQCATEKLCVKWGSIFRFTRNAHYLKRTLGQISEAILGWREQSWQNVSTL